MDTPPPRRPKRRGRGASERKATPAAKDAKGKTSKDYPPVPQEMYDRYEREGWDAYEAEGDWRDQQDQKKPAAKKSGRRI